MGEALAKLIGALVIICVIIYIAVLLLLVALAIAAIVAPPYGAYRWLRHLLSTRYTLSPAKRGQCIAVGGGFFGLPLLLLLCPSVPAPLPWWLALTLSQTAVALFLTIEAYRQAVWPHHKMIWQGCGRWLQCQRRLLRSSFCLKRVHRRIKAKQRTHGGIVREHQILTGLIPALIQRDPSFLSAERLRLQEEWAKLTTADLAARLTQVQGLLADTPAADPRSAALTLQAALARIEIHARSLADGRSDDWREHLRARDRLQDQIEAIRTKTHTLRQRIRDEGLSIRKARQGQLHLA